MKKVMQIDVYIYEDGSVSANGKQDKQVKLIELERHRINQCVMDSLIKWNMQQTRVYGKDLLRDS